MKKPNSLSELFGLLSEGTISPELKAHFLFLMGTDINFVERPMIGRAHYERGETLSYSAQVIVSMIGEKAQAHIYSDDPLSYSSPSVDVLNGPSTTGIDVGERIAQAVFLALRAAASGKTSLQVMAFSRGAAEAILVMHELDRIRRALSEAPEKAFKKILLNSPCTRTKNGFCKLFTDEIGVLDTPLHRQKLFACLNRFKMNAFLIDPVPGDAAYGLALGWHDPRFYQKPPCEHYELLVSRDERTHCFYPIVPRDMVITVVPGHHGSALGNRYTQQLEDLPKHLQKYDTTTVQDLVLLKLFHFLHQCTGLFGKIEEQLNLDHPLLDRVLNPYLAADKAQRRALLCAQYLKVKEQDPAFRYFTNTSFTMLLGIHPASDGSRHIHRDGLALESMSPVAPDMSGSICNIEHLRLYLSKIIGFEEDADVFGQIKSMYMLLEQSILELSQAPMDSGLIHSILSTPHGENEFFDFFL